MPSATRSWLGFLTAAIVMNLVPMVTVCAQDAIWDDPIDIAFRAEFDGSDQRYVLMKPKGFDPVRRHDVVVALHGHGSDRWQFVRDPRGECRAARDAALKHGFLFVSPDYRATTSWMGPAATADVRQMLRELHKQHRIGRVILAGGSMGGTSAIAFAAMHPELVDGVVSLNGTANLVEYDQFQTAIVASFGGTKAEKPEVYRERSAEFFTDRLTMPTAFTTGGKDQLVPPDSTLRLVRALEDRRFPVKSIHRPGGGHDTNYEDSLAAFEFVMERVQRGPEPSASLMELMAKSVKIVCLGDSVTGIYYHTGGRRAYPEWLEIALKQAVPEARVTVINAGISGHASNNGLERLERDVLQHQPDLVTISFGLNDVTRLSPEQYRANLEQLIDRCRERKASVVLCTPNAVMETAARPIARVSEFCEIMRVVGRDRKVAVCDQFRAGTIHQQRDPWGWRLTLSDEIHPNGDGHRRMAEELCHTISGKTVSLETHGPPRPALPRVRKLLADNNKIRVLAMQPLDSHAAVVIQSLKTETPVEVTPWTWSGQTLTQIEQDANKIVRAMKPDLVLLTIPRDAGAQTDENFIRSVSWIMNWSLSFGLQEWDVVVVHPSVIDPGVHGPRDDLIRQLVRAQDLDLIDRRADDQRRTLTILTEWFREAVRE